MITAIIMPRLWPLSKKPDTYINGKEADGTMELIPEGYSPFGYGFEQASLQAQKSSSMKKFFAEGGKNILDMWIGVAPIVMAIGTLALIVAEYTPIFQWPECLSSRS